MTVANGGIVTYTDSNGLNPRSTPYSGGHIIHTFTGSSTLNVTVSGQVSYIVVAGGAGGNSRAKCGGGGGGGGVLAGTTILSGDVSVIIGAGGGTGSAPTNGGNSSLGSIVCYGGGRGADIRLAGYAGGSGGGAGGDDDNITRAGGTGVSGQGYAGGVCRSSNVIAGAAGGGGGGATGAGGTCTGGQGLASNISGISVVYGSGGGGGNGENYNDTTAGTGGGNGWKQFPITNALPATGYGCGGGGGYGNGTGFQGIVIVKYLYSAVSGPTNISKMFGKTSDTLKKVGGIPIENIKSIMGVQ